jgi:hypothetical protein
MSMPRPATQSDPAPGSQSPLPTGLEAAITALLDLRTSLARMLEELPGVRRAADIERALGLDRPLAWRVFRSATATDPAQILQHLPTSNQLIRVVEIARARAVSAKALDAILDAHTRAEREISAVAENKNAFAALLSGHIKDGLAPIEQRVRRDAFRSNAHLWGAHCRTLAFAAIFQFDRSPDAMDAIAARAWIDLCASRAPSQSVLLSRFRATHQDEAVPEGGTRVGVMEVVPGFGTQQPLDLTTVDALDAMRETHIRLPGIGRQSRVNLFLRMLIDAANAPDARAGIAHTVCVPAEAMVLDLLVPVGWSDPATVSASAFARPNDVHRANERRSVDRIPFYEEPTFIPASQNVPPIPDVPSWPDVMQHILAERGWWGQRFDIYRLRVAYPVLHTNVILEVQPRLAPRPSA